jgi:hypothetical protein
MGSQFPYQSWWAPPVLQQARVGQASARGTGLARAGTAPLVRRGCWRRAGTSPRWYRCRLLTLSKLKMASTFISIYYKTLNTRVFSIVLL